MRTCVGYCHGRDPRRLFSSLAHDMCDKMYCTGADVKSKHRNTQTALSGGRRRGWMLGCFVADPRKDMRFDKDLGLS